MLRRSDWTRKAAASLVSTAIDAVARAREDSSSHAASTTSGDPWIDRDAEREEALQKHRRSPEYVELHKRQASQSELGLFGGEAGFERAPRTWVDPDNPHVPYMYTYAPLSVNMNYTRYGHFKRELHIIDVDKLCRHARRLPPLDLLLTDFTKAKVSLDDDGCSALIRHGARTMVHLVGHPQDLFFERIVETFERILLAVAPPMFAGPRTHADMIRVCAVARRWDEGWNQYRRRALDEAADNPGKFELTADFYDAVIDLCVSCERYAEAVAQLRELLATGHRPRISSLSNALVALAAQAEHLVHPQEQQQEEQSSAAAQNDETSTASTLTPARRRKQLAEISKMGDEIWRLVEMFKLKPTTEFFEARAAFAAMAHPALVWSNVRDMLAATTSRKVVATEIVHEWPVLVTARSFSWSLVALSRLDDSSPEDVRRMLGVAASRGVACDYEPLTFALLFCVAKVSNASVPPDVQQQCGDLAAWVLREKAPAENVNVTPEMALLAVRTFALLPRVDTSHATVALEAIAAAETVNSHSDMFPAVFYALFQLLARLGAMATYSSTLRKYVLSRGAPVSGWLLRTWLWCNSVAAAPNGGHLATVEALQFLQMNRAVEADRNVPMITREVVVSLALCRMTHGKFTAPIERILSGFELSAVENDNAADDGQQQTAKIIAKAQANPDGTATLLDLVEDCARVLALLKSAEATLSSSSHAEEKQQPQRKVMSLEDALNNAISGAPATLKQRTGDDQAQEDSDEHDFAAQHIPATDETFFGHDGCSVTADLLLLSIAQQRPSRAAMLQQRLADIFVGLPEELDADPRVNALVEPWEPTPSTLRELRVKFTFVVMDTLLQKLGQALPSLKPNTQQIRDGHRVQPFPKHFGGPA